MQVRFSYNQILLYFSQTSHNLIIKQHHVYAAIAAADKSAISRKKKQNSFTSGTTFSACHVVSWHSDVLMHFV